MARFLKIHQPRAQELRKLNRLVADDLHPRSRRCAQVIVLYGEGLQGVDIAATLRVHPDACAATHHRPCPDHLRGSPPQPPVENNRLHGRIQ